MSKWFRTDAANVHALDGIDLHVEEGEFVCLVGPSGCGKSTLLDIIAGLTQPDAGPRARRRPTGDRAGTRTGW